MQSVSAPFTAEERDLTRNIAEGLLVAWKKQTTLTNRTFTIGVSTIGGTDIIGITPGAVGGPGIYKYFDESAYLQSLAWERQFPIPTGGMVKAMAEATLDNTSGRFTPQFMGGNSELFTSVYKSRRPMIINAGFNINGVDQTLPQFAGVLTKPPEIDMRSKQVQLQAADYIDFFENRFLDRQVMFTAQRTDQVIQTVLRSNLGMSTAQYDLDRGLNTISFGLFDVGTRFSDIIHKAVEAENGRFFQDENGIFKFENRQHWDSAPYNQVQTIISTAQVIESKSPTDDNIINVVEIKYNIRTKLASQQIYQSQATITLPTSPDTEYLVSYDDPILSVDSVTITANTASDGSGTDVSSNVVITNRADFAQATKFTFQNTAGQTIYIINLQIVGRPVKQTSQLYYRTKDDSSVTAFEERVLTIENDFIQDASWAQSLGLILLQNYSDPQRLQEITIRAKPSLQLGDLISWQGHYWRIYGNKSRLDPEQGFVSDLKLLIANTASYFKIGLSTIGGGDVIAP